MTTLLGGHTRRGNEQMAAIIVSQGVGVQDRMCLERRSSQLGVIVQVLFACLSFGTFAQPSSGQSAPPPIGSAGGTVFGGEGGLAPPANRYPFKSSQDRDILRHRDALGKPCLTVAGFPRRHSINKDFNEHVISASNSCGTPIKIRVCYYKSFECILMYIPGRGRKEAILGTPSSTYQFQYEFREIFEAIRIAGLREVPSRKRWNSALRGLQQVEAASE